MAWDVGSDPPDYFLWVDGTKVGVEVTTLKACQGLFHANARIRPSLEFLRQVAARARVDGTYELVYEPSSPGDLSRKRDLPSHFKPLTDWLEHGKPFTEGVIQFTVPSGSVTLRPIDAAGCTVQVSDQGFLLFPDPGSWEDDINEAVSRKVREYGRRFCDPCWLLVNTKPYVPGTNEARQLLKSGIRVRDAPTAMRVFDRAYVLTESIPAPKSPPVPPILRIM
ncbi:MAG: hypothetical protein WBF17_11395 [Phycisphaerae bacterium]